MVDFNNLLGKETFTYEDLARYTQRFLAERPTIVLGTGATIPHGLPSMTMLAEMLLSTIKSNPSGWSEFSKRLVETKDLEQALHDVPLPEETVELLVEATWKIVSKKDVCVFEKLLREPVSFPLAKLFKYLLRTADSHLQVVTTNYDRLAEYAANYVRAYVSTGMTPGWLQRFAPESVNAVRRTAPGFDGQVSILKVHGSLDWFRANMGDIVAVPLSRDIPQEMKPLVVTPGVSKYREVHKDPFRTVMSAADAVLRHASCYLCVGYGFNDEHVQPILVNRVMKDDVPIVIVTKKLTPQTRTAFLITPPKKFIFLEEADGGTTIYCPEQPRGVILQSVSVWQLNKFMNLITGIQGR